MYPTASSPLLLDVPGPIPARLELWELEPVGAWVIEQVADGHAQIAWLTGSLQRTLALLAEATAPLPDDDLVVRRAAMLLQRWARDSRDTMTALENMLLAIGGNPDRENR